MTPKAVMFFEQNNNNVRKNLVLVGILGLNDTIFRNIRKDSGQIFEK